MSNVVLEWLVSLWSGAVLTVCLVSLFCLSIFTVECLVSHASPSLVLPWRVIVCALATCPVSPLSACWPSPRIASIACVLDAQRRPPASAYQSTCDLAVWWWDTHARIQHYMCVLSIQRKRWHPICKTIFRSWPSYSAAGHVVPMPRHRQRTGNSRWFCAKLWRGCIPVNATAHLPWRMRDVL